MVLLDGATRLGMVSPMPRPKPDEEQYQIGLRLPASLVRRADAYSARLEGEHPGMRFTRSDAIRMILTLHLPPDPDAPAVTPPAGPAGAKSAKPAKTSSPAKGSPKRRP